MKFSRTIAFTWIALVAVTGTLAGQQPAPKITTKLVPGIRDLSGSMTKQDLARGVELRVLVNEKPVQLEKHAIDQLKGEFAVTLRQALEAGQNVAALQVVDGKESERSQPVTVPPKETIQLRILSARARVGAKKVTVVFEPIDEKVTSAAITVATNNDTGIHNTTKDERAAGKADVALTWPLAKETSGPFRVRLTGAGSAVNGTPAQHAPVELERVNVRITSSVKEGVQKISGSAPEGVDHVVVRVHGGVLPANPSKLTGADEIRSLLRPSPSDAKAEPGKLAEANRAEQRAGKIDLLRLEMLELVQVEKVVAVDKGAFEASLENRLSEGQYVSVRPAFEDPLQGRIAASEASEFRRADSVSLDWGRIRGVFSTGTVISAGNSDSSSQVEPYLNFFADARIVGSILEKRPFANNGNSANTIDDDNSPTADPVGVVFKNFRFQWHTYVDSRLTQSGKAEPAEGDQTATAGDVKAQSVRSSQFTFGTYLPFSFKGMDWDYRGDHYSLFIAPILKGGWQTLENGVDVTRVTTTKIDEMGMAQTTQDNDTRKGLLPFWGYGFRAGFFKYDLIGRAPQNRQVSTDPIGYVDFTWGKNHAFRSYRSPVEDMEKGTSTIHSLLEPRIAVEARLKVPHLPAFIGIDANMNKRETNREPNDLRFLVGFRIDANRALGEIFGSDGN